MRSRRQWKNRTLLGILTLVLALTFGLLSENFSTVSLAACKGKITASSVNVRKEASASSAVVSGAERDDVVEVVGQATASDGNVWYQVEIDGTRGYIRSDLMTITEGTVPAEGASYSAEVTDVVPISAKVTGGQLIRMRGDASTESRIVTTLQNGTELTIIGQANGTDGKLWYRVEFTEDGTTVTGFIREEYVNPSGTITPATQDEPEEPVTQEPEESITQEPVVEEEKDYETALDDETWYLIDNVNSKKYEINDMLNAATTNANLYYESQDTVKAQKVGIIILIVLLLAAIGAIAYLVYKFRDIQDAAYISAVEKETMNRRGSQPVDRRGAQPTGARPANRPGQRPGTQQPAAGQRPAGARPAGQQPAAGQRPTGQRPSGQQPTAGQRPAGARPVNQPGQRPMGQQSAAGQRPAGQRPTGQQPARPGAQQPVNVNQNGARAMETAEQPVQKNMSQPDAAMKRTAEQSIPARQEQMPVEDRALSERELKEKEMLRAEAAKAPNKPAGSTDGSWKSKNFMTDEDDFEFDFLNWDGSDPQ